MHAHTGFIAQGRALKARSLSASISAQTPDSPAEGVGGETSTQKQKIQGFKDAGKRRASTQKTHKNTLRNSN